jgi:threonine dehydratase
MDLRDIYSARKRIEKYVRKTPLEYSHFLSDLSGGEVWLKLENRQYTGSFKARGAMNKLIQLSQEEKTRGIVTASSGNHAQGVGYAGNILGVDSTIVVPANTPRVKRDAIELYGVELVLHGDEYMEAERFSRDLEARLGKTHISAYNDLDIIMGQGTVGLEIAEEMPDIDKVLVPVGGGGLISGVGCALKALDATTEVFGAQSVASPVMYESLRQGRIVDMELEDSYAEGLHGGIEENSVTFELCRKYVDEIILVEEEAILRAIRSALVEQHQVIEGAAAVGVAAILKDPRRYNDEKVCIVISGGNVELDLLKESMRLTS